MNWFNIVLVLVAQSLLFWFISGMYTKTSKFFSFFKGLFLVMAMLNVLVLCVLSVLISGNSSFVDFNSLSIVLFSFQVIVLVIIVFSYVFHYGFGGIEDAKKV
jgi:hypothetical protein